MRNLTKVIEAMLDYIPENEVNFRKAMKGVMRDELYRAPEMQDWHRVSILLAVYMRDFESSAYPGGWLKPWCVDVIQIWKDEV